MDEYFIQGFYDSKNDRYLIPDAIGTDPKTVWCIVLTRIWNGTSLSFDYTTSDRICIRRSELESYKRVSI